MIEQIKGFGGPRKEQFYYDSEKIRELNRKYVRCQGNERAISIIRGNIAYILIRTEGSQNQVCIHKNVKTGEIVRAFIKMHDAELSHAQMLKKLKHFRSYFS